MLLKKLKQKLNEDSIDNGSSNSKEPSPMGCFSTMRVSGKSPFPRQGFTATLSNNSVIIFGGMCNQVPTNDNTHLSLSGLGSFSALHTVGTSPTPRVYHTATLASNQKTVVVFGGMGSNGSHDDSVYCLQVDTRAWSRPRIPSSFIPRGRHGHAAVAMNKQQHLYVCGGLNEDGYMQELILLNMNNMRFEQLQCPEGFSARAYHSMTNWKDSHIVIFGGECGFDCMDDVWVYNCLTHQWQEINIETAVNPQARYHHSAIIVNDNYLLVAGGKDFRGRPLEDVWLLDLNQGTWRHVCDLPQSSGESFCIKNGKNLIFLNGESILTCSIDKLLKSTPTINTSLLSPTLLSPKSPSPITVANIHKSSHKMSPPPTTPVAPPTQPPVNTTNGEELLSKHKIKILEQELLQARQDLKKAQEQWAAEKLLFEQHIEGDRVLIRQLQEQPPIDDIPPPPPPIVTNELDQLLRSELKELQDLLLLKDADFTDKCKEIEALNSEIMQKSHDNEQLKQEVDLLKKKVETVSLESSRSGSEKNLELESLRNELLEKYSEIEALKAEKTNLEKSVKSLEQKEDLSDEIKNLRNEISEKNHELKSLEKEIFDKSNQIKSFAEELSEQKFLLGSVERELSSTKASFQKELSQKDSEIDSLKKELSRNNSEIESLKKELSRKNSEIDSLKSDMAKAPQTTANETTGAIPPPPPPPPPIGLSSEGGAPPPPPPPPPPATSSIPPVSGPRANLLADIQKGAQLKKVTPQITSNAQASAPVKSDPMAMMLAEMANKKLNKKASTSTLGKSTSSAIKVDVELQNKLQKRKVV